MLNLRCLSWLPSFAQCVHTWRHTSGRCRGALLLILAATVNLELPASAAEGGRPPASGRLPRFFSGSFGNGKICGGGKKKLLDHRVGADAVYAVLEHFWITALGGAGDHLRITYEIDDGAQPDLNFTAPMACGQGFPNMQGAVGDSGLFHAGGKMGKASTYGGWYHNYRIPVYSHVVVWVHAPPNLTSCLGAIFAIARGVEVLDPEQYLTLPSGVALPHGTRMHLQKHESDHQPLEFVTLAQVPPEHEAMLFLSVMAIESLEEGKNDYVEGCWHLYRTGATEFPGTIFATGFEDFYDSAFWFSAAFGKDFDKVKAKLFQYPQAGLMAFSRGGSRERVSAYRFFDEDHLYLEGGGRLEWRVGDENGKCFKNSSRQGSRRIPGTIATPRPVRVRSDVWLYVWPREQPRAPATSRSSEVSTFGIASSEGIRQGPALLPSLLIGDIDPQFTTLTTALSISVSATVVFVVLCMRRLYRFVRVSAAKA